MSKSSPFGIYNLNSVINFSNEKILKDFFYFSEVNYQYRRKKNSKISLPKIKYRSVYYPKTKDNCHLENNNKEISLFSINNVLKKYNEKIKLYDNKFHK